MYHKIVLNIMKRKIKRRLWYFVVYWKNNIRNEKCFNSAKRARRYVNLLHLNNIEGIEMEKVWCYRNHQPKHHWLYVSPKIDKLICNEHW